MYFAFTDASPCSPCAALEAERERREENQPDEEGHVVDNTAADNSEPPRDHADSYAEENPESRKKQKGYKRTVHRGQPLI